MKRALKPTAIAFVLLYASFILLVKSCNNFMATMTSYLLWSLPASLIIGCLYATHSSQKGE
ncbi:multidrug transporter EmrE-like cation transporter [Streptococcus rupicaprae]|uniref:Multidrug transporter EmrE-like cation transporter n=1 Tax=Streptococcus rupicaprae TaxID=759619 RepID=A0ABV2FG29_9STRE